MGRVWWEIEGDECRFMGQGAYLPSIARQRAGAGVCAGEYCGVIHSAWSTR
jgi:hypothetical protein